MTINKIFGYLTGLVTIFTIVIHFWGYAYYSALVSYYGLSINPFLSTFELYIWSGWFYLYLSCGIFLTGYFLYNTLKEALTENKQSRRQQRVSRELKNALRTWVTNVGPSAVYLMVFLIFSFVSVRIEAQGRQDAHYSVLRKQRIEFNVNPGNRLPPTLYYLTYLGGKYVVYSKPDKKAPAKIYILNDSDVGGATFTSR